MPPHQSAVSVLIQEVLSDPDLAHDDVFRRLLQAGLQDLIDAEATAEIGAGPYERSSKRSNRRNGTSQEAGHHCRGSRPGHPQAAAGIVLPVPAVTAQAGGQGPDAP